MSRPSNETADGKRQRLAVPETEQLQEHQQQQQTQEFDATKIETENLMDPLAYASLNLEEEEKILTIKAQVDESTLNNVPNGYIEGVDRTCTSDFLNQAKLKDIVSSIGVSIVWRLTYPSAEQHNIPSVDDRIHAYIALAAQARLRELVEQMVVASKHRTGMLLQTFVDREQKLLDKAVAENSMLLEKSSEVLIKVVDDPKVKFQELEKEERDFERTLRMERSHGALASEIGDEESGFDDAATLGDAPKPKKKGKKKPVQSEAVKSRLMNDASLRASGLKSYDWMQQTSDPTLIVPKKKQQSSTLSAASSQQRQRARESAQAAAKSAAEEVDEILLRASNGERIMRPMTKRDLHRISLVDALFSLKQEHSDHRELLAKWSMNLK